MSCALQEQGLSGVEATTPYTYRGSNGVQVFAETFGLASDGSVVGRQMRVATNAGGYSEEVTTAVVTFKSYITTGGPFGNRYCTAPGTWNGGFAICTASLPLIRTANGVSNPSQWRVLAAIGRLYL
jgi:hypothetical protein